MRRKCLDSPSDRGRWCFYAVSQSLSFAGLSRSASIAAFLAGVSHTAFGLLRSPPSFPQQRDDDLLPRRARLTPPRGFLARQEARPCAAFHCVSALRVRAGRRCFPIAIKAAMVAT